MELKKRAWTEINLDALANNIKNIREYVKPEVRVMGVVKADAYGHGFTEAVNVLLENEIGRAHV